MDDEIQQRIAALEALIQDEVNAKLIDHQAYDLGTISLPLLEALDRAHLDTIAEYQQAIAELQQNLHPTPIGLQPGTTFGKYILDELMDEGGNGQVWRGREHLLDGRYQRIAIKLLKPGISADPRRVERFKKEISAARLLNHPHILRALDYGVHEEQFYVVMDFIEGKSLRHQLSGKSLPAELAINWLGQIAAALAEAHAQNFIHRDIKPENVLYSRKGENDHLFLTDFGLVYSSDMEQNITDEGDLVGTGRYMSPEQCNPHHAEVTTRSDVYALGIMAYEMLTGTLPFTGANKIVLCQHHLNTPLPKQPTLPDALYRILEKATAKRPEERYATVTLFMEDLRRWQDDPANLEPVIHAYLNTLEKRLRELVVDRFVELAGDERALRTQLERTLADSYNPLAGFGNYDDFFKTLSTPVEADHVDARTRQSEYIPNVRERLMHLKRAVLVGEPGAGKTWMMFRLALTYASIYRHNPGRSLIPVLVPLNLYRGEQPFLDFVRLRAGSLAPHFDRLLRRGRIVLLCDALNEMPRSHLDEVRDTIKLFKRFVVSCRMRDYRDDLTSAELQPLEQVILRDMELDTIRDFIRRRLGETLGVELWREMGGSEALQSFWRKVADKDELDRFWNGNARLPTYTSGDEDQAWRAMHSGARLIPLARNPFTAQMICGIYERERAMQKNRAALFGQFVASLLKREQENATRQGIEFPQIILVETALIALARTLQDGQRTTLSHAEAVQAIGDARAEHLLKAAADATILTSEGGDLKFAHQLLQEYFAARILLQRLDADESPAYLFDEAWWEARVWRETTVILGEFIGDGARGANRVARWLAPVSPEVALHVITRNGGGLTLADVEDETRTLLIHSANTRTSEAHHLGRAAAYRVLGRLNADPRPGIMCIQTNASVPELVWCEVPAGSFLMGSDKEQDPQADDDETPQRTAQLDYTFQIARYPITYIQYQAFLDAEDGFACDLWWEGLAQKKTIQTEQEWQIANHPRENVSWYQAMAFTRWLTTRYREASLMGHDREIRLPTEYEWEKAARGSQGLIYPYGNEFDKTKANTSEMDIRQTSPVGVFAAGASPYGALDMSGNVWEWCLSAYSDPKLNAAEEDTTTNVRRVLRGGSWSGNYFVARAAYRGYSNPGSRDFSYGFRVVCIRSTPAS